MCIVLTSENQLMGKPVPHYRIYSVDPEGHISAPPEVVACADDQAAIQKAEQAVIGKGVELWEGERLVARFPGNDLVALAP
jgi:hypothetical protein